MKALVSGVSVVAVLTLIAVGGARLAGIQMDGAEFGAVFVIAVLSGCGAAGVIVANPNTDR